MTPEPVEEFVPETRGGDHPGDWNVIIPGVNAKQLTVDAVEGEPGQ
jgi:hypothetical protein